MQSFRQRINVLPHLGIGVSTEYGAADSAGALDILGLRQHNAELASFLEVGVEVSKGFDADTESWIAQHLPTTYHFLDVNLDEPEDFDERWLASVRHFAQRLRPAWMCGDAGHWHFGRRDRGHMLLLPPILSDENATALAEGLVRLRAAVGLEVLPENPPGSAYLGDLHLLDFYRRVIERADTGMLLDCAHLAIYQRMTGHDPLTGLDDFPLDRVVEMHVAGGALREVEGFRFVEDSHTPAVLDATWTIFEYVAARAPGLRAVVFECERNPLEDCLPGFARIRSILDRVAVAPRFRGAATATANTAGLSTSHSEATRPGSVTPKAAGGRNGLGSNPFASEENRSAERVNHEPQLVDPARDVPTHVSLQRAVVRMLHDFDFIESVFAHPQRALAELPIRERSWIVALDRRSYRTDPDRAARVLVGLLEEFPVTAAHLIRVSRDSHLLEAFFSSSVFHRGMQDGESISVLFGNFLERLAVRRGDPTLIDLARFETAIALVRRERGDEVGSASETRRAQWASLDQADPIAPVHTGTALPATTQSTATTTQSTAASMQSTAANLHLSPRCAVLVVETPALANYTAMRAALHGQECNVATPPDPFPPRRLRTDPRTAIFDLDLPWPTPLSSAATSLLLTGVLGPDLGVGGIRQVIDVHAEEISPELGQVLLHARGGSARASLLELLRLHGAEPTEDEEILADFVRDGLLVRH